MYLDVDTLRTMVRLIHSPKTFGLRRFLLLDGLFGVFAGIRAANAFGEAVDDRKHPGYRDVELGAPIYIVAAPRSGTTFLHRLMSRDPKFTSLKLYETIFSTVSAAELVEGATRKGGPLARAARLVSERIDSLSFGGWEGLHDTGLDQDEEDEAIWAMMLATPAILLLLPFPDALSSVRFVDRLPVEKTRELVASYRSFLQRKLYRNPGKTLLLKNVLLPGRFEIVSQAAPDARFVHIVRHPYEALASMLSLFTMPWGFLAPEVHGDSDASRDLADLMIDYYRFFYEAEQKSVAAGDGRVVAIAYTELVSDPKACLRSVYAKLGLAWSAEVEAAFDAELAQKDAFRSKHVYTLEQFGLTREYVDARLGDVMDHYGFARASASTEKRPAARTREAVASSSV